MSDDEGTTLAMEFSKLGAREAVKYARFGFALSDEIWLVYNDRSVIRVMYDDEGMCAT